MNSADSPPASAWRPALAARSDEAFERTVARLGGLATGERRERGHPHIPRLASTGPAS